MTALSFPVQKIDTPQHHYQPRQQNVIQQLFRERFARFEAVYEEQYAASCGKFRLPVIQRAAEAFRHCGDWGYDFFRAFSCKSFFLCPSCGQKRTLLLGEYLSDDLLLSDELVEIWRMNVVAFFVERKLVNTEFAEKMLSWKHSGFSIESGTRIYDDKARESLSQYIVRAPVSLEKLGYDNEKDTVTWKAAKKGHFHGKEQYFSGLDLIARLTLHIPPKGKHLVRRYGVYGRFHEVETPDISPGGLMSFLPEAEGHGSVVLLWHYVRLTAGMFSPRFTRSKFGELHVQFSTVVVVYDSRKKSASPPKHAGKRGLDCLPKYIASVPQKLSLCGTLALKVALEHLCRCSMRNFSDRGSC